VRLLLDTHVLLWWLAEPERLSARTRNVLADGENVAFVSAATIWEAGIKERLGKLDGARHLAEHVRSQNMTELPIRFEHAAAAAALPAHHRDPFDRMLVAQAQCESLTFVTADERAARYVVAILPA
jgi:PIN domain nuclease of toxin-antitoxin system